MAKYKVRVYKTEKSLIRNDATRTVTKEVNRVLYPYANFAGPFGTVKSDANAIAIVESSLDELEVKKLCVAAGIYDFLECVEGHPETSDTKAERLERENLDLRAQLEAVRSTAQKEVPKFEPEEVPQEYEKEVPEEVQEEVQPPPKQRGRPKKKG